MTAERILGIIAILGGIIALYMRGKIIDSYVGFYKKNFHYSFSPGYIKFSQFLTVLFGIFFILLGLFAIITGK